MGKENQPLQYSGREKPMLVLNSNVVQKYQIYTLP